MILQELMRENWKVHTLTKDARISQAADLMRDKQIGSIVVVDEFNKVTGMLTDRDIALTLALGAGTPDSFIAEAASNDVVTIKQSMSLFDVTRLLRTVTVKRLPVVDDQDELVGIVSVDDIMALLSREMYDTCVSLEPKLGHMV